MTVGTDAVMRIRAAHAAMRSGTPGDCRAAPFGRQSDVRFSASGLCTADPPLFSLRT